jgi:DNA-binding transcriptional MerR regulator
MASRRRSVATTDPMTDRAIPDKPYFKIGEAALLVGVKPSVLRFWETEFKSVKPEKTRSNQRLYTKKTLEKLLRIRELLYEQGYTIAGARRKLREPPRPGDEAAEDDAPPVKALPPPGVEHAKKAIERAKKELRELLQLLDE